MKEKGVNVLLPSKKKSKIKNQNVDLFCQRMCDEKGLNTTTNKVRRPFQSSAKERGRKR